MKIFLSGNHSSWHVGCVAVWQRLKQLVEEMENVELVSKLDECDCLIINGEGSMHNNTPNAHSKLDLGKRAKDLGKQVHLVNSVWENMTSPQAEFIREFDSVVVRELNSFNEIKSIRPDARIATDLAYDLPIIKPRLTKEYVVATADKGIRRDDESIKRISIKDYTSWQRYIDALASAKILYTTYHHEVIAACKLRIPFIARRGSTDKVLGIIQRAGANITVVNSKREFDICIDDPPPFEEYEKLFNFLEEQEPFSLEYLAL